MDPIKYGFNGKIERTYTVSAGTMVGVFYKETVVEGKGKKRKESEYAEHGESVILKRDVVFTDRVHREKNVFGVHVFELPEETGFNRMHVYGKEIKSRKYSL